MKIYLMKQDINNDDFDTYDSCVVVAENKKEARRIHPSKYVTHFKDEYWMGTYAECAGEKAGKEYEMSSTGWVEFKDIDKIKVTEIGEAVKEMKKGIVCASIG